MERGNKLTITQTESKLSFLVCLACSCFFPLLLPQVPILLPADPLLLTVLLDYLHVWELTSDIQLTP
jgi:hypothetical protein